MNANWKWNANGLQLRELRTARGNRGRAPLPCVARGGVEPPSLEALKTQLGLGGTAELALRRALRRRPAQVPSSGGGSAVRHLLMFFGLTYKFAQEMLQPNSLLS